MPGVKSARIKADRISEMMRIISLYPHITNKELAAMFSVRSSVISYWKKKARETKHVS